MGVFGMLAAAVITFGLRHASSDKDWRLTRKLIKVSFWGLNIGLAGMLILNLFPTGVLQVADVINNGYWHARGTDFSSQQWIRDLEWARLPADAVFIIFGVLPLAVASVRAYFKARTVQAGHTGGTQEPR